jgi:GxxExxY protein
MSGEDVPNDLARKVIGFAMKVHRGLGPGFVESVYQNALVIELRKAGHAVVCQHPLKVRYCGTVVGEFTADLLVDETRLIELKAARALDAAHESQLINYLQATGQNFGLLLNFGAPSLQFRTKTRLYPGRQDESAPDRN